jgi:hypothetical protein
MEDEDMVAWHIAFGELEGRKWDYDNRCWVKNEPD